MKKKTNKILKKKHKNWKIKETSSEEAIKRAGLPPSGYVKNHN